MIVVFFLIGALALLVTLLLFGFVGCAKCWDRVMVSLIMRTTPQSSSRYAGSRWPTGGSGNRPRHRCPAVEARPRARSEGFTATIST